VAYLVTKMTGSCGNYDDEVFMGEILRHCEKPHLLDYIARDRRGHFAALEHYKVVCLNHLIDVVSTTAPETEIVEGLGQASSKPAVK
jgi:hypothetical protein